MTLYEKPLSEITLQDVKDAIVLAERAKGIVRGCPDPMAGNPPERDAAKRKAPSIAIRGAWITPFNLAGLYWDSEGDLRIRFKNEDGDLGCRCVEKTDTETQDRIFALAGYRPNNPWEGEV